MNYWVVGAQVATALAAFLTIVWGMRRERHKPDLDKVEVTKAIKAMADESNAWRDTRLWQLEGYLNLDQGWHLTMITNQRLQSKAIQELVDVVEKLGGNIDHIHLPPDPPMPPPIPDPPVHP